MTFKSDPIYKRDSKGRIRVWSYEVEGDQWRTVAGLLDGKMTVSAWTTCTPKSQKTGELQAQFEAKAELTKKLDRDYRAILSLVDRPRSSTIKPMLAQKYDGFPGAGYSQPKLDGIRCLANTEGLWTRTGQRIYSCPHIEEALAPYFEEEPDLIFDGELYNHELKNDFNQIISLVRKTKPTDEDLEASKALVQYHLYDLVDPTGEEAEFGERFETLCGILDFKEGMEWFTDTISLVPTNKVTDEGTLNWLYTTYLEQGYEGQMFRHNGPYEQKRSKMLLKRKEFQDAEYPISRIGEGQGNWAGYAKYVEFILPGDKRTVLGERPKAGIKGNQEFCKKLLTEDHTHITVRFFELTPEGIPRFPIAVDFFSGARG